MWSHSGRRTTWIAALVAALLLAPAAHAQRPPDSVKPRSDPAAVPRTAAEAAAIADFVERVNGYVALHRKLEATLPKLPKEATPQQIDQNTRALGTLIAQARTGARRGDLFTPEMTAYVKKVMNRVFAGKEGKQLRASIMDENVKYIPLKANMRYPTEIPLTTMPPDVLAALPALPEQLEFRFIGEQLVLLDPHAHIVADFIVDALPGR